MRISAKNKNILVTLSAFGWSILCVYILTSGDIALVTRGTTKSTIMVFAAPFIFFGLGCHHWTKQRGNQSLSILSFILGVGGIVATWAGIDVVANKESSLNIFDFLIIPFGITHLVLGYWCYQNSPHENLKSKNLDLGKVLILYKEISASNFSNFKSDKYGRLISDAALQAMKENQLNVIANLINLGAKLEETLGDHKVLQSIITDRLSEAYVELEIDAKYEIFPLFINKSGKNTSHYFHELEIQKWALNSYEELLQKDNLTIRVMEKQYFENTPLAKDYPNIIGVLHEYIEQQKSGQ